MEQDSYKKKPICIYNPSNHLITAHVITEIFRIGGFAYQPHDIRIFQQSLTHKSYVVNNDPEFIICENLEDCVELQLKDNEELEFIGDSIIGGIVALYLYRRYPRQNQGFLTKLKTKLVRTNMLAKFSTYLGLGQHVLISKYFEDMCDGRANEHLLDDTFEAFTGALYIDVLQDDERHYGQAMQICRDFFVKLMEDLTDFRPLTAINDNYKELLLQYYHKNFIGHHPLYHEIHVEGPIHRRKYTMGVKHPLTDHVMGQGTAYKKTTAEQIASHEALKYLGKHGTAPTQLPIETDENNTSKNDYESDEIDDTP